MGIQQFKAPPSTIDALTKGLSAANEVYGIQHAAAANDYLKQKTANEQTTFNQQQGLADITAKSAQDNADPDSDVSQAKQEMAKATVGAQAKILKLPSDQTSNLLDMIDNMSGSQIDGSLKEGSPLGDLAKGTLAANAASNKMAGLVGIKQEQLAETKNQHSDDAGKAFETDPIIKLSKTSLNSLDKSQSILSNPNKPVTSKDLNLAYNDYINSVAQGGAATEGKITRELPETWEQSWNELKGKAGDFDDLRQSPTGAKLIDMLNQNISTVRGDMQGQISNQAQNIYSNYGANSNPQVQQVAKSKLQKYSPDGFNKLFPDEAQNQSAQPSPQPQNTGLPSHDDIQAEIARRRAAKGKNGGS